MENIVEGLETNKLEEIKKTPSRTMHQSNKGPIIKKSRETLLAEYKAKDSKMIRGQFLTYHMKGLREMPLTYKLVEGNVFKKNVRHGDILELPYGYIRYLNNHCKIKREQPNDLRLEDESGHPIRIREEDDEQLYFFRVLDPLTPAELAELEPSTIVKAKMVL